jgi:hypothetical protein
MYLIVNNILILIVEDVVQPDKLVDVINENVVEFIGGVAFVVVTESD